MDAYPLLSTLNTPAVGLATWEAYDPSVKVHLTSTALRLHGALYLFDPIPFPEGAEETLKQSGIPTAILLTSGNHERSSLEMAQAWAVPIYAPDAAIKEYSPALATHVIPLSQLKQPLPFEAIALPGGAAGETAYYIKEEGGIAIVGDALIHLPTTGFCLLPEKYCEDATRLRESVATLAHRPLSYLTFAHGRPLTGTAARPLAEKIAALPE